MKYEDFEKFVREKCMYETIYEDSDGRQVLIIQMLDAYGMLNKAQREWVGLTEDEIRQAAQNGDTRFWDFCRTLEAKLKEKNA